MSISLAHEQQSTRDGQRHRSLSRVVASCVTLISTLQGTYFALQTPSLAYTVTALLLALSTVLLATRIWSATRPRVLWLVLLPASAQFLLLLAMLLRSTPPLPFRLLLVAVVLSYFAATLTVLLAGALAIDARKAALLSLSTAIGLFLCEAVLQLPGFRQPEGPSEPEWVGELAAVHPTFGLTYRPGSVLKTYYPDNPRGYFKKEEDPRNLYSWWVRVAAEGQATLVKPRDNPKVVRLAITRASKAKYDVQLNQSHFRVRAQQRYTIDVTARAESARQVTVGFAMAHEPWSNLGLYQTLELTPAWQRFQLDFTSIANDDNARIHFDAGNSDISIEVSSVTLRRQPGGTPIAPDRSHGQYYVSYQFNSLGCRGRDYEMPRPAGTGRILLLGDSFTQGIGVHERDTFASQLEQLLNEENTPSTSVGGYEVVNCGVSGFGTREERLFYEQVGERYQPQVVLLVMVTNDDMSFFEEVEKGYAWRRPGRLGSLSYVWRQIEEYRHRRPFPDYQRCARQVSWLGKSVRAHGARFGVVIFRSNGDYEGDENAEMWDHLTSSVTAALRGTDVPLLDLGPALVAKHPGENLLVHEIDGHPNDIAHHTAAQVIFEFLRTQGLLPPP